MPTLVMLFAVMGLKLSKVAPAESNADITSWGHPGSSAEIEQT